MSTAALKELWEKYNKGTLQPEEWVEFESLLQSLREEEIGAVIDAHIEVDMQALYGKDIVFKQITANIDKLQTQRPIMSRVWIRYAAAAVMLIGCCLFLWKSRQDMNRNPGVSVSREETNVSTSDILLPDDSHAVLKLQNGQRYAVTDDMKPLETEAVRITPLAKGIYAFDIKEQVSGEEIFHVFETPRGVSTQLQLADGTQVWLNASSKIEVSSLFNGLGSRQVRLSGEAYFEVAHNTKRPFYVDTEGGRVEVKGTSFNVWARPMRGRVETTLAKGQVLVRLEQSNLLLAPGEQALTKVAETGITKRKVDVERVLAWKRGYFNFVDSPITEILEELADWYDIEQIEWQNKSNEKLTVSLARTRSLAELLDKIELIADVKLAIKERRILVK